MLTEASREDARRWFGLYHYTGTAAGHLFLKAEGLGMIGIGRGGNRFGVAGKFGLEGVAGGLEITRVAVDPTAPRNTASRLIAAALRCMAERGCDWLFSYADSAQGHHGGIYQAVGAHYVGTDAKQWVNFSLDGLRVSKRKVSGMFGSTRWPEVRDVAAERGLLLERVEWKPKLTYILIATADRKKRRALTEILAPRSLPYVKRGEPVVPTKYRNSAK